MGGNTHMVLTLAFLAVVFLLPVVVAWITWRLTRQVQRTWLRSLIRAVALAAALTPTLVSARGIHGAVPLPAVWVLICGILGIGSDDRMRDICYGGVPLLVVSAVIWLLILAVTCFRHDQAA